MSQKENLEAFYARQCSIELPKDGSSRDGVFFNAGVRDYNIAKNYTPSMIRNFYKIALIIGDGRVYYGDKGMTIDRPALMFSHPNLPYSWECLSEDQSGYYCLFNEEFLSLNSQSKLLAASPLRLGGHYVFFVTREQENFVRYIFQKLIDECNTSYQYKHEVLLHCVNLLIHEALKITPSESFFEPTDSPSRIAMFFTELLERQFPVDPYKKALRLKTPQDYANQLSVHVNHLNRSVKKVTGKTTSSIITDRLIAEAKVLLVHSGWNIAEVSYSLGFEDPSYFARVFKQHTGIAPTAFKR
jgi:AraC family transcriptional regulator, transcriptional activator of pobA